MHRGFFCGTRGSLPVKIIDKEIEFLKKFQPSLLANTEKIFLVIYRCLTLHKLCLVFFLFSTIEHLLPLFLTMLKDEVNEVAWLLHTVDLVLI